jgi:hypothetical protein
VHGQNDAIDAVDGARSAAGTVRLMAKGYDLRPRLPKEKAANAARKS